MRRRARIPDCHPERPHMAHGKCGPCYQVDKRKGAIVESERHLNDPQLGLVRGIPPGWGAIA